VTFRALTVLLVSVTQGKLVTLSDLISSNSWPLPRLLRSGDGLINDVSTNSGGSQDSVHHDMCDRP
jgi:hypothetical protein